MSTPAERLLENSQGWCPGYLSARHSRRPLQPRELRLQHRLRIEQAAGGIWGEGVVHGLLRHLQEVGDEVWLEMRGERLPLWLRVRVNGRLGGDMGGT